MKRWFLPLCFLLASCQSWAFFDFDSYTANTFTWNPAVVNPVYTFTVDFRSYCNGGCVGQEYRIALSDENPGTLSPATPGSEPDSYDADELSEFVLSASFTQGSNSGSLIPGEWSHDEASSITNFFDTDVDTVVTGTFSFTLNSTTLQGLDSGTYYLEFYVAGEDMYNTRHLDSMAITIPIEVPDQVQITGLEDMIVYAANLSGNNLDVDQTACVFSNTGYYMLDFDGSSDPGNNFQLSKNGQCTQASDCVEYRIRVTTTSENNWLTFRYKGHRDNSNSNAWTASDSLDCYGSENLTIRVRLKRTAVNSSEAGLYSDTMTVTVIPL